MSRLGMMASAMAEFDDIALDMPAPINLAALEAIMIWPDDPEARRRWVMEARLSVIEANPLAWPADAQRACREQRSLDGRGVSDLFAAVPKRILFGKIMGVQTLVPAVLARAAPERASIGEIQRRLCEELSRIDPEFGAAYTINPRTIQNRAGPVWRYRVVAHFWAAHQLWIDQVDTEFPCSEAMLPEFLLCAEKIRVLAEAARTPHSPAPVLQPGEAHPIPARILEQIENLGVEVDLAIAPALRVV